MGQFAHLLRDTCDWRLVALVRAGLAFIFALGLARLTGARLVLWRPRALWLRGCASSLSLLCTFYAFTAMPTAEVVTLTNTFPIWVALMSWPLLNTRPGWQSCAAASVGVLGVALIQSPRMSLDQAALHAVAVSLVAALANAIAMLGLNRLKGVHPWAIVAHYSGIATLFALGACFVGGSSQLSLAADARTVLLLIAVGIAATAGQLCVTQAFTYGEPSRVSVVALFQVVFSLALDLSISGQTPPPVTLAGIALTVAPTTWVMMRGRMTRESPLLEQTSSAQVDRSGQCFEDLRAQRLGKLPHPCGLRSRCGCHS